jgi:hypothetical protein
MPRPHELVDFPRKGPDGQPICRVAIQVLSQEEHMAASAETDRYTKRLLKELPKDNEARRGYDDIYNNQAAIEILFRACRKPDDVAKPFFPTPMEIAKHLSADEIGVMMNLYFMVRKKIGPIVSEMSEAEAKAWIRRIKEAGADFPLGLLSSVALIDLVCILASQITISATGTSWLGLQPSSGSPSESEATPEATTTESSDTSSSQSDPSTPAE